MSIKSTNDLIVLHRDFFLINKFFRRADLVKYVVRPGICRILVYKLLDELIRDKVIIKLKSGRYMVNDSFDEKIVSFKKETALDLVKMDEISVIFSHWNRIMGQSLKGSNKVQISLIRTRLREGHSIEDFISVMEKMKAKWQNDPVMSQYLRIETLFNGKFNSYLEIKTVKTKMEQIKEMDFTKYFGGTNG